MGPLSSMSGLSVATSVVHPRSASSKSNMCIDMMSMMSPSRPSNISELSNSSLMSSGSSGSSTLDSSNNSSSNNNANNMSMSISDGIGASSTSASSSSKRSRMSKASLDQQKDGKYFERRKRNNVAAKKSRDARKQREDEIAIRASFLEKENSILKAQLQTLKDEAHQLRILLAQKKTSSLGAQVSASSSASSTGCSNCSNCSANTAINNNNINNNCSKQQQQQQQQNNSMGIIGNGFVGSAMGGLNAHLGTQKCK